MTQDKQDQKETKADKEAKKNISDDVEKFFKDVWGKVVEYAAVGAEEATKVSATAKTRVDIETLKFKRGKLLKMLGERYWDLVAKDSSLTVAGTGEIIKQIKSLDREVAGLEKEISKKDAKKKPAAKGAKKPAAKKKTAKKAAAKKPAAKKTARKPAERKPDGPSEPTVTPGSVTEPMSSEDKKES